MTQIELLIILRPLISEAQTHHVALKQKLFAASEALPEEATAETILKTMVGVMTSWLQDHRPGSKSSGGV